MRHQWGVKPCTKGASTKTLWPQALMHNFIYKIQKKHLCTMKCSKYMTFSKIDLEIIERSKICWFLSFHVQHLIAKGTNFQISRTELFFSLLYATETLLTL